MIETSGNLGSFTKEQIESLNLTGIGFELSSSRFYPEGSSSAHLLGFVGFDAKGENNNSESNHDKHIHGQLDGALVHHITITHHHIKNIIRALLSQIPSR